VRAPLVAPTVLGVVGLCRTKTPDKGKDLKTSKNNPGRFPEMKCSNIKIS